jgi:hypothetical protein
MAKLTKTGAALSFFMSLSVTVFRTFFAKKNFANVRTGFPDIVERRGRQAVEPVQRRKVRLSGQALGRNYGTGNGARNDCYKTFYGRNLQIFVLK